jgi:predicted GNAT family acetyltransferase
MVSNSPSVVYSLREIMAPPNVTDNAAAGQFEIHTEGGTALLRYLLEGDRIDLVHTEVPAQFQGKGYGEALVRAALDYARREQLKVVPTCPFVRRFIAKHRQYADLVAPRGE